MPAPPLFRIVMLRSVTLVAVDSRTPALVALWMVPPEPSPRVPPPFLAVVRARVVFAGSDAPSPSASDEPVGEVSEVPCVPPPEGTAFVVAACAPLAGPAAGTVG